LTEKTEELGEKPVPAPLCPPQIPHGLTLHRTRASAVGGGRLTAWAMARPSCFLKTDRFYFCLLLLKPNGQDINKMPQEINIFLKEGGSKNVPCPMTEGVFCTVLRSYISWSSSLRNLLQSAVTSPVLGPNSFHSALFSNVMSLCPSLSLRDQVSHPYKKQEKL
jgi:hypothetical protein